MSFYTDPKFLVTGENSDFVDLLARRSRLRWSLTGVLVLVYFSYSLAGLYASEFLGSRFFGWSFSWSIVVGYLIMALSIALALFYVRASNRLVMPPEHNSSSKLD